MRVKSCLWRKEGAAMNIDRAKAQTCSELGLPKLFPAYIDGDLSEEAQEGIEDHLAECAACQDNLRFFLDLQKVGSELFHAD
jgi:anti-sigma factor RsiW